MSICRLALWAIALFLPVQTIRAQHPEAFGQGHTRIPFAMRTATDTSSDSLQSIVTAGQRLYNWTDLINARRSQQKAFLFNTPLLGYPVERPLIFSSALLRERFARWLRTAPQQMVSPIISVESLPPTIPIAEEEFRQWGDTLIRIYELATRLRFYDGDLGNRNQDIRGYYVLIRESNLEEKLTNWPTRLDPDYSRLKEALVRLCYLQLEDDDACAHNLEQAITDRTVFAYYTRYKSQGESVWQSFFHLQGPVDGIVDRSSSNAHVLTVLFQPPEDTLIARAFQTAIEKAWHTDGWQVKIQYSAQARARLVFQPNVTPHVEGITMVLDANQDLQEPITSIAFQHEFGHILGFEDCYVQFYDPTENVFVNYQFDTKNIMCSRIGHVLPQHIEELNRTYMLVPDNKTPEKGTFTP